ncbi:MAG: thiamine pyrophosphate-binding protein [Spirochaetaceae bacterium]|jgi:acetolactate synthase-1/2/3 large subunit|nr:thiamine pyrophosphate-binding protein [Spirochaetaceae bacterium]
MSPINYSIVSHNSLENKTCAEILVEYLKLEGVGYVFGIPGGTIVPLLEAIENEPDIDFIMTRHEAGAAFMADMYARATGKLGVCLSTAGPGATNMLTGVACAHRDGVPLLAITGQPATHTTGKGAVQESSSFGVDTVRIYEETCGFSSIVSEPAVFRQIVTTALRVALGNHKQAVHISLPSNISSHRCDSYEMPTDPRKYRIENKSFDPQALKKAVALILDAKKPAILLGSAVNSTKTMEDLISLAEEIQCPVMTSPQGKGRFPETHELCLGVFGFAGSEIARDYLLDEKIDLLVVIGSTMDEWTTNAWDSRISPEKYLIQIDSDSQNIGKNFPVSLGVIGDINRIIHELNLEIQKEKSTYSDLDQRIQNRMKYLMEFRNKKQHQYIKSKELSNASPIKPQRLFHDINQIISKDGIVITDAGNSYAWSLHHLKITPPQSFFISLGFASMGHGTAGAPGVKLAFPDREVIVFSGDGSFLMNGNEIHTAVQYNIPVLWIILNDNTLGMVYHGMKALTGRPIASEFSSPVDFCSLAQSLGAHGARVTKAEDIIPQVRRLLDMKKPAVLDVLIDREEEPPFLERIKGLKKYNQ